jgi:protoporphyrinogen IX oxidase
MDWYKLITALHVISMVSFFAGTFHVLRLFIHHKDAEKKFDPERAILVKQFIKMERFGWYTITWPSLVLMVLSGIWLLVKNPGLMTESWMYAKLGFSALLIVHHLINQRLFDRIRTNRLSWGGAGLRLWNLGAVAFLFALVFLVAMKSSLGTVWGLVGALILGIAIALTAMMYRTKRSSGTGTKEA